MRSRRSLAVLQFISTILWASAGVTNGGDAAAWPFSALRPVDVPAVAQADWVCNEIDAFVLAKLEASGLQPAPPASPRTLIRRLYFDVIGLPPTPVQVNAFVDDSDPTAYERLVDRLLDDPRYGERWARYWLDLARYADTAGYEGDPDLPHAWRYRDYVIESFNTDKPYDLFIREQLAGDEFEQIMGAGELPEPPAERVVAMTFLRLAPFTEPRGDESRHEMLSEMTSTVGSVFLGLTVGCAKCHDHKYDAIPTEDFYRLKAFFATIQIPPPERGDGFQIGGSIDAEFYRDGEPEWAEAARERYRRQRETATDELAKMKAEIATRVEIASAADEIASESDEKATSDAVTDLILGGSDRVNRDERRLYEFLSTRDRFVEQHLKRLEPAAMSLRHSFGPPYEPGVPTSRVMLRGEYNNPGEVVEPGFLSVLTGNQDPAPIRLDPFKRWPTRSRRMALAHWIASPDNPMTARVLVNRLWQWHFGQGIVRTPSDFGQLSGGPSHQKLVDWLANRFIENQWSMKAMHRLILNSNAYRQSSQHMNPLAAEVDPDNRLLWRFTRRRLDAEAIRDSVLFVSGRLNREQYGLPIFPPLPSDIAETVKFNESKWDTQYGPEGRKRSIYIYQQRTLTMPLMQTFDALVCDESRPLRRSSVTPLQALALYNGEFVNEEAAHFAARVKATAGDEVPQQITTAFQLALGRTPTAAESTHMQTLCNTYDSVDEALIGLCRILYNTTEFSYID